MRLLKPNEYPAEIEKAKQLIATAPNYKTKKQRWRHLKNLEKE